jgi:MFS transporter, CP family, cyanate transporter
MGEKHFKGYFPLLLAVCAVAAALKTPISNIGTVTSLIKSEYGISSAAIGSVTTITLLTFSIVSLAVNAISKRLGVGRTVLYSLFVLIAGMIIRSYCGLAGLYIGTVIVAASLIFGNVLVPGFIKAKFGNESTFITGIYLTSTQVFCALAAGTSYGLATQINIGWKGALAIWAVLAAAGAAAWAPFRKTRMDGNIAVFEAADQKMSLFKNKTTWLIAMYMGLQSMIFYCLCAWYPTMLQWNGMSPQTSSYCFMVLQLASIPSSATVSFIVMRNKKISKPLIFIIAGYAVSLGILMFKLPVFIYFIAAIITGYCCGACFCLAILLLNLKTSHSDNTNKLSGAVHAISYIIAGGGPVLLGVMFDNVSVMVFPVLTLLLVLSVILGLGLKADRSKII